MINGAVPPENDNGAFGRTIMALSSRMLLLSILSASAATAHAGWAHGWRDQYIRVSQRLGQRVSAEVRHMRKLGLLGEHEGAPEHLKQKARDAIRHAERVHHAQRHNARELAKPEHERRKLMEVECEVRAGLGVGVGLGVWVGLGLECR